MKALDFFRRSPMFDSIEIVREEPTVRENRRPAQYQIHNHFRCTSCNREIEVAGDQTATTCHCGGRYESAGESYPASSEDWDEERDNEYSPWRQRR